MHLEMAEEEFKRENADYVVNRLAEFDINMAIEIKKGYLKIFKTLNLTFFCLFLNFRKQNLIFWIPVSRGS